MTFHGLLQQRVPVREGCHVRFDKSAVELLRRGFADFGLEVGDYDGGAFGDELGGYAFALGWGS